MNTEIFADRKKEAPDIVFVNMPFDLLQAPRLGLGILKAVLSEAGIRSALLYGNLLYAEEFGVQWYLDAENEWNKSYLGDWLFQRLLFPEKALSPEDMASRLKNHFKDGKMTARKLEKRRQQSEAFINGLAEKILNLSPRIAGCSLTVMGLLPSLALMKTIKEQKPDIAIAAGGPACDGEQGIAMLQAFPFLDYVFCGDAEKNIVPFVKSVLDDTGKADSLQGILSAKHLSASGSHQRATTESLDNLPEPDYSDYFNILRQSSYLSENIIPAIPFEGSRGCQWGEKNLCLFCGDCGTEPHYRTKSADTLIKEIKTQAKRYGCDRFYATDNMVNPKFFDSFFQKLADSMGKSSFFFETRASLNENDLAKMRKAGVTYLQAGLESLDSRTLRLLNKGVKSYQNIQLLKHCRQYGILLSWFIMTGIPGEDDKWNSRQAEIIPLLQHLEPPRFVGGIRPDRFSPYYKNADKNDLAIFIDETYSSLFDIPESLLERFAFHLYEKKQRFRQNDEMDFILRPGNYSLAIAVNKWLQAFWNSENIPALQFTEDNGHTVTVRDTRPAAVKEIFKISGLQRQILLESDLAPTEKYVYEKYSGPGRDPEEISEAIRKLVCSKVLLKADDRLVGLPLKQECLKYPDNKTLPMGWVNGQPDRS